MMEPSEGWSKAQLLPKRGQVKRRILENLALYMQVISDPDHEGSTLLRPRVRRTQDEEEVSITKQSQTTADPDHEVDPSVSSSNSHLEVESQVPVEEVVDPSVSSSNSYLEVESQVPVEEVGRAETSTSAELKEATKFSYFATALAGGGILSLLIFHLENKSGEPHTLFFKALTFFVLATFASGLSIILLTICAPSASYQIPIIRGLVSATLIFLALTGVGVSIALMKAMGELAFVPVIVVVIVACIIVYYKKTVRSGQCLLQQRRIE